MFTKKSYVEIPYKLYTLSALFTPALNLTLALIPPPQESALTPFRAAFYAGQRLRKEKI